jgi:hypothetical protein
MTRSILAVIAVGLGVGVLSGTGCKQTGVGDPCVPEQEYQPTFQGFNPQEVNVESKSFQCQTRLCLVNHFQGRVSCPYGQFTTNPPSDPSTGVPSGAKDPCYVPGSKTAITGNPADPTNGHVVPANCLDRTPDKAVYCSCRCQNVDGRTDDGANYCTCPDGFHCSQLVTSIGAQDTGLTGGYCVKDHTDYDRANSCGSTCDPTQKDKCGTTQL